MGKSIYFLCAGLILFHLASCENSGNSGAGDNNPGEGQNYSVIAYNDLGMHCMNKDFSELMILPSFNTLRAQVIKKGSPPVIVQNGFTLKYSVPGNTYSAGKTNFWDYAHQLLGLDLLPNVGLTGNKLTGAMTATPEGDWAAAGIPLTPLTDALVEDPFQLGLVEMQKGGVTQKHTRTVVPVSWEISCDLCHNTPGLTVAEDILTKHDARHGTHHMDNRPVKCVQCHQQPELGDLAPGAEPHAPLSHVIHHSHAERMEAVADKVEVDCYACHPGNKTKCLRDVHAGKGLNCHNCHIDMMAVADETRSFWQDEPRCGDCHNRLGATYEQPGVLYRNSVGHGGAKCYACHGSPHAITPTVTNQDNLQAMDLQGYPGPMGNCAVCHAGNINGAFKHAR